MTRTVATLKLRFNKSIIEGLEPPIPPADRYYAYDATTPRLAICVTSAGLKTFYRVGRINGVPERLKLGRWPEMTIEQARNKLAEENGKIAKGQNPADERRAVRSMMTLGELWDYYLEHHARPHKRSVKADEWLWCKLIKPRWENRKISQIRRGEVQQAHAAIGQTSIYNANRCRSLLLTMYNIAADAGYEGENPVARVKPFREAKRERFLTGDEVKALFSALDAEANQVIADVIRFALWTGQRRGNCMSARWDEIRLDTKIWTIPATKAKAKKPIVVPLTAPIIEILKRRQTDKNSSSEWVFPGRYGGHVTTPKDVWASACKAADITDARVHDLRRTMATFAVNAGVPIFQVAKLLGHNTTVVTEAVYAMAQDDSRRRAAELATAAILAAAKPPKGKRKTKDGNA